MKKEIKLYMACAVLVLAMLAVLLLGGKQANAQEVPINEETFPEEWLRNLMLTPEYDLDGNGVLCDDEIQKITSIEYVYPAGAGWIYAFRTEGLKYLPQCSRLSVSNLVAFKSEVNFNNNLPSSVEFDHCQLGNLEVRGKGITSIRYSNSREDIEMIGYRVTPVSGAAVISYVEEVDVSGCPNLETLQLLHGSARELQWLSVKKCKKLKTLWCEGGKLRALNVANNKQITDLRCGGNYLKTLDISSQKRLKRLDCAECGLTSLDVSHNLKLKRLECSRNILTQLDLHNNKQLKELHCFENELKSLDLRKNSQLEWVSCRNNQIYTLRLPNTSLVNGERRVEGSEKDNKYYYYREYPEYSNFRGNQIHTLDIACIKRLVVFTRKDLMKFLSGEYYKNSLKNADLRFIKGKGAIKKLIINKNMRKKDVQWIKRMTKRYKMKLIYR